MRVGFDRNNLIRELSFWDHQGGRSWDFVRPGGVCTGACPQE
jgi:hypothetical protein